ncbi:TPA: phospholipid carrier-dependent glycosyltransferase [Candidatus Berkelbacteria bacterium]|uniref:Glycosyl transferase family protein n=1 Tax=Berkelbacteria bacterium GW2011_GWE1_39_12 TaxID=1618337 RepID=A0A0G4B2Q0_9BACT|nr:MAG: glycosyl transferase family protein [Berkelbacteria bacterium GW2011_GWE1_39_12]HBO60747.1 phospholipid carrier-dependent glycosyltransferase [Candidatus Berkelbacteria bacterium]
MKLWQKITLALIFVASFGLMIYLAKTDSITADEPVHLSAGYLHIVKGSYKYNTEHPPLMNDFSGIFIKVFVNPKLPEEPPGALDQYDYGYKFIYQMGNSAERIIFWGRFPVILLFLATMAMVFLWSKKLWGANGALFSTFLAAICPNLLANGHLATTDVIITFSALLNLYLLCNFIEESSWKNAIYFGLATGLLLLSKFSGLTVLLFAALLYFLFIFLKKQKLDWDKISKLLVSMAIAFFMVWLIYIVSMWFDWRWSFYQYNLHNFFGLSWFKNLAKWFILPLMKFWDGFGMVTDHNKYGHLAYLNGKFSQMGFWDYFPYAFWYKTPLAIVVILALSVIKNLRKINHKKHAVLLLILAPLFYFLFSMTGHIDIGVRHILVIYPFLYILAGGLILTRNKSLKAVILILTIAAILTNLLTFPDYLSFMNKSGIKDGTLQISDSNYDWGQNLNRFSEVLSEKNINEVYFDCYSSWPLSIQDIKVKSLPDKPVNGLIAMCAQQYFLKLHNEEGIPFKWFLKETPTGQFETIYYWDYLTTGQN